MDRVGDGQGGGDQPVLGAAHLDAGTGCSRIGCASFKLSNDPKFADKLKDVVGLYVDPPAHAVVLSIDEKSQIQALDRTQPGLPMKKGRCATMTHDYKRNGTTTLFAALDILEGKVIGRCMQRHRHQEFIRFLNAVEREVRGRQGGPCGSRQLRHPQAPQGDGLARTGTNASPSTSPRLPAPGPMRSKVGLPSSPGSGSSAACSPQSSNLQAAINRFIADANGKPKPFVWTKSADAILAAVHRGRQALEAIH